MGEAVPEHPSGSDASPHPLASPSPPAFHTSPRPRPGGDSGSLAELLCPILREACGGRLSAVQWFRSAWQAGGASTGTATFQLSPSRTVEVVVKLPIGPREYEWTSRVGFCDPGADHHAGPTPRVLAAGTELGGYDLAWLIVERLEGQPLSAMLSQHAVEGLLHAAAAWYKAAAAIRDVAPDERPKSEDWEQLMHRGRDAVRDNSLHDEQRWHDALKHAHRVLPRLLAHWDHRAINTWCHGDLHPGNALLRTSHFEPGANGSAAGIINRCVLIDLALVHAGHWIEDALYLERLFWAKPDLLFGVKPVATLARFRREHGLDTSGDYGQLALIRRVLMAATVPAFLEHEGHPKYVRAALDILERSMASLGV